MAFTPDTLSAVVQSIGGAGIRMFTYQTDDSIETVTSTDYFASGKGRGLRVSDIIFVSPIDAVFEPYTLVIETVDAAGNATATISLADINGVFYAQTRPVIKALRTRLHKAAYLTEAGRSGLFIFRTGDYSAEVAADPDERIYIEADDTDASVGAWVREDGTFYQSGEDTIARPYLNKVREWLHVADFAIAGNGSTDDTEGFQKAVVNAGETNRRLVFPALAAGSSIRLTDTIEMPYACFIEGEGTDFDTFSTGTIHMDGSWFYLDHTGKGFYHETGYGVGQIRPNGGRMKYKGIGTFRNQPAAAGGWEPNDHDWDFWLDWADVELEDVNTLNPTRGIHILKNGRTKLRNIRGQGLGTHIQVSTAYDVTYFQDIYSGPIWSQAAEVLLYQQQNSIGIRSLRNDNMQGNNIFSILVKYGLSIGQIAADAVYPANYPGGTTYLAALNNVGFDGGYTGIYFEADSDGATVMVNNGYSLQYSTHVADAAPNIRMLGSNNRLLLNNFGLFRAGGNALRVEGTGNRASGKNLWLSAWDQRADGWPALQATSGNKITTDKEVEAWDYGSSPIFDGDVVGLEKYDNFNGNTDGSGDTVVTHGLGGTPRNVQISPTGGRVVYLVTAKSATTFTVRWYTDATFATPVASGAVAFDWVARS